MSTPYSRLDRALHYAAFSSLSTQVALGDIERAIFRRKFTEIKIHNPVFITALPRAGTTVLLSVLADLPDFATHTYRDMPFILTPMLWASISERFRTHMSGEERAHGDGLLIDYDTPEAFEEIAWKAYWKEHYKNDRIIPWTGSSADPEFLDFMRDHMRKIIYLHGNRNNDGNHERYISKNNANIARLNLLIRLFPDCQILIPFRHPWHHAKSLARQHQHFTEIHSTDSFSRRYMEWLGHYEFGAALKPINFDNWIDSNFNNNPATMEFWLSYWKIAYSNIQKPLLSEKLQKNITLLDYDRLCQTPQETLPHLSERLDIQQSENLLGKADQFRPSKTYDLDKAANSDLYHSCITLYETLQEQSLLAD